VFGIAAEDARIPKAADQQPMEKWVPFDDDQALGRCHRRDQSANY
jgi:hypothetical protein